MAIVTGLRIMGGTLEVKHWSCYLNNRSPTCLVARTTYERFHAVDWCCVKTVRVPQKLQILTRSGALTEFAAMNVQLSGERSGLSEDFHSSERAGAIFAPM